MRDFISIDFETGNPQRVSACALGYAKVSDCKIAETKTYLMKPVGGHALFQSRIHGIKEEHTYNKPAFSDLFPKIKDIFSYPLVGHSLFDLQVLLALSDYFHLGLNPNYIDSSAIAREKLPNLKNFKLATLAKHFGLPDFKHHDAGEDATTCAGIFLKLQGTITEPISPSIVDEVIQFEGIAKNILTDNEINYKEAYELLYWLDDHSKTANQYQGLHSSIREVLTDNHLAYIEAIQIKTLLQEVLRK